MKKHQKTILGFVGLGSVAALTTFAASLPSPEAVATTSVTDTITVRVVGDSPAVTITSPANSAVFVSPNQIFSYNYENINSADIIITRTDANGEKHTYTAVKKTYDYEASSDSLNLNLYEYGYTGDSNE